MRIPNQNKTGNERWRTLFFIHPGKRKKAVGGKKNN
jgi:hypothetical protein